MPSAGVWLTSFLYAARPVGTSYFSSSISSLIVRPLTPPALLMASTWVLMPSVNGTWTAAVGPVRSAITPMLTSLAVTPSLTALAPPEPPPPSFGLSAPHAATPNGQEYGQAASGCPSTQPPTVAPPPSGLSPIDPAMCTTEYRR